MRHIVQTLLLIIIILADPLLLTTATIPCPSKTMMQFITLSPNDLPLCGNGVLDKGEVCDDGNRLGGDGCNAWCSAFDRMTKACTIAGQNKQCARGTILASSPSQSSFCSLSSVAVSPDGKYLIVSDGATLIRMDLFTDSVMNNLYILPATGGGSDFGRFCSVFIKRDLSSNIIEGADAKEEDIIIAHDCEKQSVVAFIYDGSTYMIKTTLPLVSGGGRNTPDGSTSSKNNNVRYTKSYLDHEANQLVIAGIPLRKDGLKCVEVYGVELRGTFKVTLLGTIDCVAFNVFENGRSYPSFSMDGMLPYRILREACPFQMNAVQCYAVYMERNDLQFAKAYISVDGGGDIEYVVSTDETLNVLGAPLVMRSEKSKITYTLTGNCFTASNTIISDMKLMPPVFALGYSCGPLPFGSGKCSTPLNNPFITDIVSSSYLLPEGLSSTHEHQELLDIFLQGNASSFLSAPSNRTGAGTTTTSTSTSTSSTSTMMVNLGGLPLYRQILENVQKGNIPIDFVEIPHTQDIVYITETTIGMINSKGMMLMDIYNPGYCRPIDAIMCPLGQYGSVGGVCRACDDAAASSSVSAQIQCSGLIITNSDRRRNRRLLSTLQSAPYTQVSMVVSNKVRKHDIDALMKFYLLAHGYNCTDASAMSSYQPYNMAADIQDASSGLSPKSNSSGPQQNGKTCSNLIPCIIESAGNVLKKNMSLSVPEEYLISWTLQNSSLVHALAKQQSVVRHANQQHNELIDKTQANRCDLSNQTVDTLVKSKCMIWINSDFHLDWLPCALSVLNSSSSSATTAVARRRHLLQTGGGDSNQNTNSIMLAVPHAQGTFVSATSISWGVLSKSAASSDDGTNGGNKNVNPSNNNNGNGDSSNMFLVIVVAGSIAGVLITVLIVGILYLYFTKTEPTSMLSIIPQTKTNMDMTTTSSSSRARGLYMPLNAKCQ